MASKPKYYDSEPVIDAFLTYTKVSEIAKATKLNINTVYKYKRDPVFQKILTDRRLEIMDNAVSRMQTATDKAVEELIKIITKEDVSDQIRLNAINSLLSNCKDWTHTIDVIKHMAETEERLQQVIALIGVKHG